MTANQVRRWLGLYFVVCTSIMGGLILIFSETPLLPIRRAEGIDTLSILAPVLLGQLMLAFQWYSRGGAEGQETELAIVPAWIVKSPPIASGSLFALCLALMIVGNRVGAHTWTPSPETFKAVVTFSISILNVTTVFIVGRFFPVGGPLE